MEESRNFKEKVAFSNENGYVRTGPYRNFTVKHRLRRLTDPEISSIFGKAIDYHNPIISRNSREVISCFRDC